MQQQNLGNFPNRSLLMDELLHYSLDFFLLKWKKKWIIYYVNSEYVGIYMYVCDGWKVCNNLWSQWMP